jgi:hypothetical protein
LPVPVAIELDRDAERRGFFEHRVPVGRHTRTIVEHPSAWMPEDGDAGMPQGVDHSRRLIFRLTQDRVRRRHDELESRAFVGLEVEIAVHQDVRLDPLEDAEAPLVFLVQPVDLDPLPGGVGH